MATKRKIDPKRLERERAKMCEHGLNVIEELKKLTAATERCLKGDPKTGDGAGYPLYMPDLLKSAQVLYQLSGAWAVLSNLVHERR